MRTVFSLGDLSFVAGEGKGSYTLMHTHPEEYVTPEGEIMGGHINDEGEDAGGTMTLATHLASKDTRNILPSDQDIDVYKSNAESYWRNGHPLRFGNTPLFNDPRRTFKSWILNPWGGSEIHLVLDKTGELEKIVVHYAFAREKFFQDEGYKNTMKNLERKAASLGVPIEFVKISRENLLQQMPFPTPDAFRNI
jgi:hypothetical protein